jgi:signal transduction histidine kinase
VTALRDDDEATSTAELRELALYLATIDRRGAAAAAVAQVLHDLGNPTAAVVSNLRYVADSLSELGASIEPKGAADGQRLVDALREALSDALLAAQELSARIERFRVAIDEPRGATAAAGGAPDGDDGSEVERAVALALAIAEPLVDGRARIERALAAHLPRVAAPTDRLAAILVQLLLNAIEAGAARVTIGAAPLTDDRGRALVALTIDDDGAGVPAELRPRLMHALATSNPGAARGLGLVRARAALLDLGGDLQITSRPRGGTSVRALVPQALREGPVRHGA